ncbi:MAG: ATP-binding protein [gamma proteobacterium endosymbiont of Lamellibrachia anaximandri]|nr:ATP-binding protein [gamma proteobacterium endosymbiont of Lamellibrachia anaximandri]
MADEHGSVEDIQSQFVSEAKQAPLLFSDLAKVELYIAETYRTRAFVELLQNADDARAKTFVISYENNKLVVANDGAAFSLNDLMALCRSGSSTKTRGAGTIGYRGIGFKSVVGIANEIDVISGDYAFRFSKEMTKSSLNIDQDVPLIRIPHHIDNSDPSVKLARSFQQTHGVTTVFLMSGINQRVVEEEIRLFDETSVLFLNSVKTLNIDVQGLNKKIVRKSEKHAGLHIETIVSGEDHMSWIVAGQKNGCEKVAVKYDDNKIITSKAEESVIHAFLPTQEYSGGNLKLNGDFSTDPSRKSVDLDERSIRAFNVCASLLSDMLREAVSNHSLSGIFSTLASNPNSSGRFREILRKERLFRKICG